VTAVTFVEFVNQRIKAAIAAQPRVVVYGQNVGTGSCLSGLSRGFDKLPQCTVINTTNSEGTLVGMGFGLLLRGVSSIFFMKQQDFLLLGVEQLTSTANALRNRNLAASFTIVAIVVDSGWEGPQSCLNNLADFSSISHVPAFAIAGHAEAEAVIERHLPAPGFRILGVSQRLFRTPVAEYGAPEAFGFDKGVIRHATGEDATIVSFNLAFPQAMELHRALAARGLDASLYSVPATMPEATDVILDDVVRTRRLVVIDDSKSVNAPAHAIVAAARARAPGAHVVEVFRAWTPESAAPNADQMEIDASRVVTELTSLPNT
jgi:pyruvate/2-oxoglutarate/acetoin dehydrogenase E1 component